jgi:hypothetical protein
MSKEYLNHKPSYFALHFTGKQIHHAFIKAIFMQLWDPEYIFDTFSDYKCYCPTGFYMFWASSLKDTSARKDHFGRWINNSSNH